MPTSRPTCPHCHRPTQVCVCADLRPIESRTRVVFLQHPREARVAVSTCRLAHRSLPNSELHVGLRAEGSPRLEALAREPDTMVLFPGEDALDARTLPTPPRTLIVVDGSWINARKVVDRSPLLSALPRIGFVPSEPSRYRIRKEPAAHCLSTIEAVASVLEAIEDAPGRFGPMLASFDRMVDRQIAYAADPPGGAKTPRHTRMPSPTARFRGLGDKLVLLFLDSHAPDDHAPTLLHWVAIRLSSGERFESLVHLPRPMSRHRPRKGHVPMPDQETEAPEAAIARWCQFTRDETVLCTWGRYPIDLLRRIGIDAAEHVDLKRLVANVLHAPLGGVEHLAESLGADLPNDQGPAMRKLTALETVARAVLAGELRAPL